MSEASKRVTIEIELEAIPEPRLCDPDTSRATPAIRLELSYMAGDEQAARSNLDHVYRAVRRRIEEG